MKTKYTLRLLKDLSAEAKEVAAKMRARPSLQLRIAGATGERACLWDHANQRQIGGYFPAKLLEELERARLITDVHRKLRVNAYDRSLEPTASRSA